MWYIPDVVKTCRFLTFHDLDDPGTDHCKSGGERGIWGSVTLSWSLILAVHRQPHRKNEKHFNPFKALAYKELTNWKYLGKEHIDKEHRGLLSSYYVSQNSSNWSPQYPNISSVFKKKRWCYTMVNLVLSQLFLWRVTAIYFKITLFCFLKRYIFLVKAFNMLWKIWIYGTV